MAMRPQDGLLGPKARGAFVRRLCIIFFIVLRLGTPLGSPLQAQGIDRIAVYYVAPQGNCGGATPCFDAIQKAIDRVDDPNDVVKVAAGTYNHLNDLGAAKQVVYIGRPLTLRGGYSIADWEDANPQANQTVIDAQGGGRGILVRGARATVEGFTITRGDASGLGGYGTGGFITGDCGGGVYAQNANLLLERCTIQDSLASSRTNRHGIGGGVFALESRLVLSSTKVLSNTGTTGQLGIGGGLFAVDITGTLTIEGSLFENNAATTAPGNKGYGGGIAVQGSAVSLASSEVRGNRGSALAEGRGGGIHLEDCNATIQGTTISSNTAGKAAPSGTSLGGGLYATGSSVQLAGSTLQDNGADVGSEGGSGYGGGLYIESAAEPLVARITGSTLSENRASHSGVGIGGGLYLQGMDAALTESTLRGNIGGHTTGYGGGLAIGPDPLTPTLMISVTHNLLEGNVAATLGEGSGGALYLGTEVARDASGDLVAALGTVAHNTVLSNTASLAGSGRGGGVALSEGALFVSLIENVIQNNVASSDTISPALTSHGGGVYIGGVYAGSEVMSNTITHNVAGLQPMSYGGGLAVQSATTPPRIVGNTVAHNTASRDGRGHGGGISIGYASARIAANVVRGNRASQTGLGAGGGLYIYSPFIPEVMDRRATVGMSGNTVVHNRATESGAAESAGGGLWSYDASLPDMTNNIIAGNDAPAKGGGLSFVRGGEAVLLHNTIANNGAIGVYVGEVGASFALTATNSIVSGHSETGIYTSLGSRILLTRTLWHGNGANTGGPGTVTTTGDLSGDPAFVSPATGDYHIRHSSAAIDAASESAVSTDIDGEARPCGEGYDLGADEQCAEPPPPLNYLYIPLGVRR